MDEFLYVKYWYNDTNECVQELEDRRMEIVCEMQKVYDQHGACQQFRELLEELHGTEGIYRTFRRTREQLAERIERMMAEMDLERIRVGESDAAG